MTPTITGGIDEREPGWIVLRRTFRATREAVWYPAHAGGYRALLA